MSYLFAGVLLFTSPGCPHDEPNCITPTEYVEVTLERIVQLGTFEQLGNKKPR
jgi:hypothetical protein